MTRTKKDYKAVITNIPAQTLLRLDAVVSDEETRSSFIRQAVLSAIEVREEQAAKTQPLRF